MVMRMEKEELLLLLLLLLELPQSRVSRYLQEPWKLKIRPSNVL